MCAYGKPCADCDRERLKGRFSVGAWFNRLDIEGSRTLSMERALRRRHSASRPLERSMGRGERSIETRTSPPLALSPSSFSGPPTESADELSLSTSMRFLFTLRETLSTGGVPLRTGSEDEATLDCSRQLQSSELGCPLSKRESLSMRSSTKRTVRSRMSSLNSRSFSSFLFPDLDDCSKSTATTFH